MWSLFGAVVKRCWGQKNIRNARENIWLVHSLRLDWFSCSFGTTSYRVIDFYWAGGNHFAREAGKLISRWFQFLIGRCCRQVYSSSSSHCNHSCEITAERWRHSHHPSPITLWTRRQHEICLQILVYLLLMLLHPNIRARYIFTMQDGIPAEGKKNGKCIICERSNVVPYLARIRWL